MNDSEKHRIDKYIFDDDKKRSTASIFLQKYLISKQYKLDINKINISYNKFNKPYFKNNDNFHYNVSHDKEIVVIVGYFDLIGIDIMKIDQEMDINYYKLFFNKDIWKIIVNSNNNNMFYEYWCIIESYFKYIGNGISKPQDVIVNYNEKIVYKNILNKFQFKLINFKDYIICLSFPINDNILNQNP